MQSDIVDDCIQYWNKTDRGWCQQENSVERRTENETVRICL